MHDELINSMELSKKMLELTSLPSFCSPMNPTSIPMARKYSNRSSCRNTKSNHRYAARLSTISNNETTDKIINGVAENKSQQEEKSKAITRISLDNGCHDEENKNKTPNNTMPSINIPSPPSSTRSSFDATISSAQESVFITKDESYDADIDDDEKPLTEVDDAVFMDEAECIDQEISFILEELIETVQQESDDSWNHIKIEEFGETILPSGLRIINGVADMPFFHDDTDDVKLRFTNQLNFLKNILSKYICRHKYAGPFLNPVDSFTLKIPHYYLVIKNPMDLNTVRNRLNFLWYQSASECISDIKQIFKNCYQFNPSGSYVYDAGRKLEAYFEEKAKDMPPVEEEIECPSKPSIEEFQKLNEKRGVRRSLSATTESTINSSIRGTTFGNITFTPIKMTTRSERGVMVRKPSKDLPTPISTPQNKLPVRRVPLNKPLKECLSFVKELFSKKHSNYAWPFWQPVDTEKYPDYLKKIKKPIDLTTIKTNIETGKYTTIDDFAKDMRLMFSNCLRYNPPESPIILQVRQLREAFEYRYAQFPEDYLRQKLVIPKNPVSLNTSVRQNYSASSSSSHVLESSNQKTKKTKSVSSSSESSGSTKKKIRESKIRVSPFEPGQAIPSMVRFNGNSREAAGDVSSENRMKMLELQVQSLMFALNSFCGTNQGRGRKSQAEAIFNAFGGQSLQNGFYQNGTAKKPRKNGYKTKNTKKSPKTYKKKRKHLSSDEEEDSDDDLNSFGELQEPFDPENMDDLKKLKSDLENLHASDLQSVLRILQTSEPSLRCDDEQNVEIDFGALQPRTLIALRKFVSSCMLNNVHNKAATTASPSTSSNNQMSNHKNKKPCRGTSQTFDTDCDNSINDDNNKNWSNNYNNNNLQLSEVSSSDSEMDE